MPTFLNNLAAAVQLPGWALVVFHSIALPFIFMPDVKKACNNVHQCREYFSKLSGCGPTSPTTTDPQIILDTLAKFQQWSESLQNLPIQEKSIHDIPSVQAPAGFWPIILRRHKNAPEATQLDVSDIGAAPQPDSDKSFMAGTISDIPMPRTTDGNNMNMNSLPVTDGRGLGKSNETASEAVPHDLDINALVEALPLFRQTFLSPPLAAVIESKPQSSLLERLFPYLSTMLSKKVTLVDVDMTPDTQLNNSVADATFFELLGSNDELSNLMSAPCMVPIPYQPPPNSCHQTSNFSTFLYPTDSSQHAQLDFLLIQECSNHDDMQPGEPTAAIAPSYSYSGFLPTTSLTAMWGVALNFLATQDRSIADEPGDSDQSFSDSSLLQGHEADTNNVALGVEIAEASETGDLTSTRALQNVSTASRTRMQGRHRSGVPVPSQYEEGDVSFVAHSTFFS